MQYRMMTEEDIKKVIPLYLEHYNIYEEGQWTEATAHKRIHQVWSHEDALCLIAEDAGQILGFAIGHMEQYDDLVAYDLIEIVIAHHVQGIGLGARFMEEIEKRAKGKGAAMVQISAVNDPMHEHFYGKLGYQTCNNLVLKSKFL